MTTRRAPTFYTAPEWIAMIEEFHGSQLTKKAWCEEKGITLSTMYRWQRRLGESVLNENEQGSRFVELPAQQPMGMNRGRIFQSGSGSQPEFTIEYGGYQLHMNEGFSEEDLRKVMRVMRNAE